jgi:hypothetical protein
MNQIDSTRFFNAGTKRAGCLACSRQVVSTGAKRLPTSRTPRIGNAASGRALPFARRCRNP